MPTTDTERMFGGAAPLRVHAARPVPFLPWGSGGMRPCGLALVGDDAVGDGTCRDPALPVLWQRPAPLVTVVLDDIVRSGEQAALGDGNASTD